MGELVMAIQPIIAGGAQRSSIPLPQRNGAVGEGLNAIVEAVGNVQRMSEQSDRQSAAIDYQIAEKQRQEAEAAEASTGQVASIKAFAAARESLDALRNDPAMSLKDHAAAVSATAADVRQQMLAAFPSERVRQRFAPQVEQDVQELVARETAWREGQTAKLQGEAGDTVMNAATARIFAEPTPAMVARERDRVRTYLRALPLSPAARAKLESEVDVKTLSALSDGLIDQGAFDGAEAVINSPEFGAVFGADGVRQQLARVSAGRSTAAAAVKASETANRKAAQDTIDAYSATIEQGGVVPDAQLRAAEGAARSAGVEEDKLIKFRGLGLTQAINRQFGPAADPDGIKTRAAIADLNSVAAQRPLTSDESMRYQRLIALTSTRRAGDAETLKPLVNKSAQGDVGVLAELDKRPAADRFDTAEKVQPGLGYFGLVAPGIRAAALQGSYDLRANPDLTKATTPKGAKVAVFAQRFRDHLGPQAMGMSEAAVQGYAKVAEGLYAYQLKNAGRSGWDQGAFVRAANQAMGAHEDARGEWRGGIGQVNGRNVMLPDWMTARGLETVLARGDFSGARYRGGRTAAKSDILRNFVPVLIGGGGKGEAAEYEFYDAGGQPLLDANNRTFVARIAGTR